MLFQVEFELTSRYIDMPHCHLPPPTTLPTAPPSIADAKNLPNGNQERNRKQPAAENTNTTQNGSEGQQGKDEKVGIQATPFPIFFITVFDTQPSKFSCSHPSLARKARRRGLLYIFTFFYHIRTLPPPSLEMRDRGVFPPRRAVPTMPKLAPPAEPICQTPCQTCKTRLSGHVYMFVPCPSPQTQKIHPSGCVFHVHLLPHHPNTKDTPRWACLCLVHVMGLHTHVGTRVWVARVQVRV